jgi:hypothetical protein
VFLLLVDEFLDRDCRKVLEQVVMSPVALGHTGAVEAAGVPGTGLLAVISS